MTASNTFIVGNTYATRSACDHECVFEYTVIKRTAKFVTVEDKYGRAKRCGVTVWDGIETMMPQGRFSMAPIVRACD